MNRRADLEHQNERQTHTHTERITNFHGFVQLACSVSTCATGWPKFQRPRQPASQQFSVAASQSLFNTRSNAIDSSDASPNVRVSFLSWSVIFKPTHFVFSGSVSVSSQGNVNNPNPVMRVRSKTGMGGSSNQLLPKPNFSLLSRKSSTVNVTEGAGPRLEYLFCIAGDLEGEDIFARRACFFFFGSRKKKNPKKKALRAFFACFSSRTAALRLLVLCGLLRVVQRAKIIFGFRFIPWLVMAAICGSTMRHCARAKESFSSTACTAILRTSFFTGENGLETREQKPKFSWLPMTTRRMFPSQGPSKLRQRRLECIQSR